MIKKSLFFLLFLVIVGCQYVTSYKPVQKPNLLKMAKEELRKGNCEEASNLLKNELKERGSYFQLLFWMGVSEAMCERYGKAYRYLQKSLGYAPSQRWTGRIYATTGFIFHLLGKRKEASVYFKLAKETRYPTELVNLFEEDKLNKTSGFKVIFSWM